MQIQLYDSIRVEWMKQSTIEFLDSLAIHRSKNTVYSYSLDLIKWLQWMQEKAIKKPEKLQSHHLSLFLSFLIAESYSPSTVCRIFSAVRGYIKYLVYRGIIQRDITIGVQPPNIPKKRIQVPTPEQMAAILAQPDVFTEKGLRDKAIMELLYSSGLRISEAIELELKDVTENAVFVEMAKRDKPREVPITQIASYWIQEYINRYRGNEEGYLFLTSTGCRMQRERLNAAIVKYARKANVEGVTAHTFRHACASHLLESGADLVLVKDILGHASIATTQIYTQYSAKKLQDAFQKLHPRTQQETYVK